MRVQTFTDYLGHPRNYRYSTAFSAGRGASDLEQPRSTPHHALHNQHAAFSMFRTLPHDGQDGSGIEPALAWLRAKQQHPQASKLGAEYRRACKWSTGEEIRTGWELQAEVDKVVVVDRDVERMVVLPEVVRSGR